MAVMGNQSVALLGTNSVTSTNLVDGTIVDADISSTSFPRSLGVNGHIYLFGGLLIQWGETSSITGGSVDTQTTVTFPIAYTTLYQVQVTSQEGNNGPAQARGISNTGFAAVLDWFGGTTAAVAASKVSWMAIGVV